VIPLTWSEGGPIQEAIDLEAIYGFGPDDIYAAGERLYLDPFTQEFSDSSLLIHYNGSGWSEVNLPFGGRNLRDVWGTSPGNVWTSGWSGTLYHQEGIVWSRDSVRVSVAPGGFFQLYGIAGVGSTAYLLGNTIFSSSGTIIYYFFRRPANTWVLVDSFVIGGNQLVRKWGGAGLWTSPEGTLLSFGYGLFRWESPSWNSVFSSSLPFRGMAGTSEENIFLVGDFGKIYHYNGTDWYQFADLEFFNVVYEAVWMGKKQAFIVGNTGGAPQKTIILHGQ
jgi:hypothetical protein